VPNFYTPENAVEAFSYLCAHRRNQSQLLEVPAALAGGGAIPRAPDMAAIHAIRDAALAAGRTLLSEHESKALLRAFGLDVPASTIATGRDTAVAAARAIGFPVALKILSPDIAHKSDAGGVRLDLEDESSVAAAYTDMLRQVHARLPQARLDGVVVQPMLRFAHSREVLVGLATDAVFGPVITFGAGGVAVEAIGDTAIALPPLNEVLAKDLIARPRVARLLDAYRDVPAADRAALIALLTGVSGMACLLPWIREMDLNPVLAHPGGAAVVDARIAIDPSRLHALPRYGHMAIHPYPAELEGSLRLRDGTVLALRPMRPEDAGLERDFVARLSPQSRYLRFHSHLMELQPDALARFTQLDYDRELALVALAPDSSHFVGVGRYAPNPDGTTAEFALAVADAWQGRGLGSALLSRLAGCAQAAGYRALEGHILDENAEMLQVARRLGFTNLERQDGVVSVRRTLVQAPSTT
jgi:acetyltransferase